MLAAQILEQHKRQLKDREGKTSGGDDGEGLGADGRADHGGREDDGETCGRYQINGGGIT